VQGWEGLGDEARTGVCTSHLQMNSVQKGEMSVQDWWSWMIS
jgi:hypothetical protein